MSAIAVDKVRDIWDSMDDNERAGVRFGMFPAGKMQEAESDGYNEKDLVAALMNIAEEEGGMRA